MKSLAVSRSDLLHIAPENLHVEDDWNCRDVTFDPKVEKDLELAKSVAENGVLQPITATFTGGRIVVRDGHRRLAAVRYAIKKLKATIPSMPVQKEPRFSTEADQVFSQISRNSGKPFTPIETAKVYQRLFDLDWSEKQIATKSGCSAQWVKDLLVLNTSPDEVKKLVNADKVSASMAIAAVRDDPETAFDRLSAALTVAESKGKARATPKHLKVAETPPEDAPERVEEPSPTPETQEAPVAEPETETAPQQEAVFTTSRSEDVNLTVTLSAEETAIETLRDLCGYVENGTATSVTISQDDATFGWVVSTGGKMFCTGTSVLDALLTAFTKIQSETMQDERFEDETVEDTVLGI